MNSSTHLGRGESFWMFGNKVEVEAEQDRYKGLFMSYNPVTDIIRICQREYQRVIAIKLKDGKVVQDSFVKDMYVPDKSKARELYKKRIKEKGFKA